MAKLKRISILYLKEEWTMDISSVTNSMGIQYEAKNATSKKEGLATDPNNRDLGVIVEISKDSQEANKLANVIKERTQGGKSTATYHRTISGNGVDGMVSFYGANVTGEQCKQLQSVIKELEEQGYVKATPDENGGYQAGDEALGSSWEPGTYAQLGLKVSQLNYACKELGLSDEVVEQITGTYSKQAEAKINKVNRLIDSVAKQMEVEKAKLHQMLEEYGENPYENSTLSNNTTGKSSVELNMGANADIYKMFATLDTSSKENFKASFQKALDDFREYFADAPIELYTGTSRENMQLEELMRRFESFLANRVKVG